MFIASDNGNDYGTTDTLSINIDLFNDSEPADITLKFNIRNFLKVKNRDKYVDAIMIYNYGDTLSIKSNIRIKARGKNRREVCMFPPLYININDSQLKNGYLANTEKIKFVTHCIQTKRNNDCVLKEYLLYKMFNLISPYSFRVRLARVKYIDTGRNNRESEDWGFFIEPEEMLALRLDAVPLDIDYIDYNYTEPENTDIMSMFQYIIGNSDYSIRTRQNIKLLKIKDSFFKAHTDSL